MSRPDVSAAIPARQRVDGWTPDRQRAFLDFLADGLTVEAACRGVGLTHQSAYALRKRACGAGFSLGWEAAQIHARARLAAVAYSRALDGYTETTTRPDGSVVARHKFDNRLLMAQLSRLDRLADAAGGEGAAVTRHLADNFEEFCDLIEFGRTSDVMAFAALAVRDPVPPEFAAVARLREAERYMRDDEMPDDDEDCDRPDGDSPDTSDLVVAERQGWSAAQWARALDAGLVELRHPGPDLTNPQLPQLDAPSASPPSASRRRARRTPAPAAPPRAAARRRARRAPEREAESDEAAGRYFVWIFPDDPDAIVYTAFPPRAGFDGLQHGVYPSAGYWRVASPEEADRVRAACARQVEAQRRDEARLRDEVLELDPEPAPGDGAPLW